MIPKFLKKKSVIISVLLLVFAAATIIAYGIVPALSVAGKRASLAEFQKIESAISHADRLSRPSTATSTPSSEIKKQAFSNIIDRIMLNKLAEDIDQAIDQKAKDLVNQIISQKKDLNLAEAASKLYGLSAEDFIKYVLLPQAKRDFLNKKFSDNPARLTEIWDNLVRTSEIKIYYPGYYWENGEVKKK